MAVGETSAGVPGTLVLAELPAFSSRRAWRRIRSAVVAFTSIERLNTQNAASDVQIALRVWNFYSCLAQFLFNEEIQIALEAARPMAHFGAPDDKLKIDRALAEFRQEDARRRV